MVGFLQYCRVYIVLVQTTAPPAQHQYQHDCRMSLYVVPFHVYFPIVRSVTMAAAGGAWQCLLESRLLFFSWTYFMFY